MMTPLDLMKVYLNGYVEMISFRINSTLCQDFL